MDEPARGVCEPWGHLQMKPLLDVEACLNAALRPHRTLSEREGSEFKSGTTPNLIDTYK
jgi:hypothetical protein